MVVVTVAIKETRSLNNNYTADGQYPVELDAQVYYCITSTPQTEQVNMICSLFQFFVHLYGGSCQRELGVREPDSATLSAVPKLYD
jgi:hypothetical protein